jgi:PPOX class probable F420-dependent enzyme
MTTIDDVRQLVSLDMGLAVVTTRRDDETMQSSVVNSGVIDHPVTSEPTVAMVVRGDSLKVRNLRVRPNATVVFRAGWEWVGIEGPTQLVGPDDTIDGVGPDRLAPLLREVFSAAGGAHDDWDAYDRVMAEEGRVVVLVDPARIYGARPTA